MFQVDSLVKTPEGLEIAGFRVSQVLASSEPFITKYEPTHPDADAEGVVSYPNVNPVEEMVNLTEASRSFDANVAVLRAARAMSLSAQDLLRVQ